MPNDYSIVPIPYWRDDYSVVPIPYWRSDKTVITENGRFRDDVTHRPSWGEAQQDYLNSTVGGYVTRGRPGYIYWANYVHLN